MFLKCKVVPYQRTDHSTPQVVSECQNADNMHCTPNTGMSMGGARPSWRPSRTMLTIAWRSAGDLHFYMRHSYQPSKPAQSESGREAAASAQTPAEPKPEMRSAASRQLFSEGARSEPYKDQAAARHKRNARRRDSSPGAVTGGRRHFADLNQGFGHCGGNGSGVRNRSNGTQGTGPHVSFEGDGMDLESVERSARSTGGGAVDPATINRMYSDFLPSSSTTHLGGPSSLAGLGDPYDVRGLLAQRSLRPAPHGGADGTASPQMPPFLEVDGSSDTGSFSGHSAHHDEYLGGQGRREEDHVTPMASWQDSCVMSKISEARTSSPPPPPQQQPLSSCPQEVAPAHANLLLLLHNNSDVLIVDY